MTKSAATYPRVRWYDSLIVRVMVLCAVLLLCLLGSVYEITRQYFGEVVREMEAQTEDIARRITLHFEEHSGAALEDIEQDVARFYAGTAIQLDDQTGDTMDFVPFSLEKTATGELVKTARLPLELEDRRLLLTARVSLVPQAEILRAFKNNYLALLTIVFIVTLGLMVYFIARILRPLSDLAASCRRITSGETGGGLQKLNTRNTSGEVRSLEATFNGMVAALQEKEKIEANLRQAQRLSAIGNLAAGVAHDVRNPLNAIKLLSAHAIDTMDGSEEAAAETKRHLQTIKTEVNRLEEIVSGFLSLAKERQLQPESTKIDIILAECVQLVRKDAEARAIRLVSELRSGDTALSVDPKQLTRAILNVLINAMDVCPREGRVRLFSRLTDQSCEIEVRDDGPGMPPDIAERAFEPYFTTKDTGTGLGLSITRGIIEEHGGNVALSSAEGQGCQILISLPLEEATK